MKSSSKIWVALIVIAIIAIGGYFFPKFGLGGGQVETVVKHFAGGLQAGRGDQFQVDNSGNIVKSPDGFVLWDDFTVGTTSPVRGALINTTGSALMCDADSLFVYSDATGDFSPSFKFAVGTTTATLGSTNLPTTVGYSANIVASTTVATTTDTVTSIGSGWTFLLPVNNSVTLSVGDYSSAIASSTYYGNWSGQFGVHCWTLGQ